MQGKEICLYAIQHKTNTHEQIATYLIRNIGGLYTVLLLLKFFLQDIPQGLPIFLIEEFAQDFSRIQTEGNLNDNETI